MEEKRFTLLFLVAIYNVFLFKLVYNTAPDAVIHSNFTTEEANDTGNHTTTGYEDVSVTEIILGNTTNTTEKFTETSFESSTPAFETTTTVPTKRLPKLSNAFQARIRYSGKQSSASTVVSYDLTNNRAAVTKKDSRTKSRQIYDFTQNQILNITDGLCSVEGIPDNSSEDLEFPFPFNFYDREKNIKGPLGVFRLDGNDIKVAEKEIYVSGIPCVEYYTDIDIGQLNDCKHNTSCRMRQFYSTPVWRNPNCKSIYCDTMPVRIQVECDPCYFVLTLSFLEYHDGIKDEKEFQQFPGVYCENAKSEPFPKLSSSFSGELVEHDILNNNRRNEKLWWSKAANILRIDYKDASVITDYNRNLTYNITKLNTECQVEVHYEEKPSMFSFLTGSKNKDITGIQRVGKRECELSECEVWTGETISGETFDIYMKTKNLSNEVEYIPVFVHVFKNKSEEVPELYSRREFVNYISSLGDWSAFDISACYLGGSSRRFEFTIKGDVGERWENPLFRENIYNAIWDYSKVTSPLRLQKLQMIPVNNETITVKGIVIDDSSIIRERDASYVDISSEDAIKNIQEMSNKEGFFENEEGHNLKVTDFKIEDDKADTGGKTYGPGEMGGLAVGMLVAGMICGTVVVFLIMQKRCKRK